MISRNTRNRPQTMTSRVTWYRSSWTKVFPDWVSASRVVNSHWLEEIGQSPSGEYSDVCTILQRAVRFFICKEKCSQNCPTCRWCGQCSTQCLGSEFHYFAILSDIIAHSIAQIPLRWLCHWHKSWKSSTQIMSPTFVICVRHKVDFVADFLRAL